VYRLATKRSEKNELTKLLFITAH